MEAAIYQPEMSDAGLRPTHPVTVLDEYGDSREVHVAGESPLTLFIDDYELVTLMTLGTFPEALAIGYLRNQRFIRDLREIRSVHVDWKNEHVRVSTFDGIKNRDEKTGKRTITTGCGQGTIFNSDMSELYDIVLPPVRIAQSYLYNLLQALNRHNEIYKQAGAVHGCALCHDTNILTFVEDVGRHNAADAIAGQMWLNSWDGGDKVFYTTGRLTSEIIMKVALMGIPVLLSRSGVTFMGMDIARDLGVTMIARAKGHHFLIYNGAENVIFDAVPDRRKKVRRESTD